MNKIYTGIGSRNTPKHIYDYFIKLGTALANHDYTLRSGGAPSNPKLNQWSSDEAFEIGCDKSHGSKEIYLPWRLFGDNPSPLYHIDSRCYEIISSYCSHFQYMRQGQKKCVARDVHQIYGKDPDHILLPDFVVCYAKLNNKGQVDGGTQYAYRIAQDNKVKIFNAYTYSNLDQLGADIKAFLSL